MGPGLRFYNVATYAHRLDTSRSSILRLFRSLNLNPWHFSGDTWYNHNSFLIALQDATRIGAPELFSTGSPRPGYPHPFVRRAQPITEDRMRLAIGHILLGARLSGYESDQRSLDTLEEAGRRLRARASAVQKKADKAALREYNSLKVPDAPEKQISTG
jgi:hypothetical protein